MGIEDIEVKTPAKFILAGNAEFSIQNTQNKVEYDYKVVKAEGSDNLYFVYATVNRESVYAGCLRVNRGKIEYMQGKKGNLSPSDPAIKGLLYALCFERTGLKRPMIMYHHGRCALCGRRLKDAESVSRGFGPDCWKRAGDL